MAFNPMLGEIIGRAGQDNVYPAKHYITQEDRLKKAIVDIETELDERSQYFKSNGQFTGSPTN